MLIKVSGHDTKLPNVLQLCNYATILALMDWIKGFLYSLTDIQKGFFYLKRGVTWSKAIAVVHYLPLFLIFVYLQCITPELWHIGHCIYASMSAMAGKAMADVNMLQRLHIWSCHLWGLLGLLRFHKTTLYIYGLNVSNKRNRPPPKNLIFLICCNV
jgi:hypothetical protein